MKGEEGEEVVPKDGDANGDGGGDGDEVLEQPPPPKSPFYPLPKWLQKALQKDTAVCQKASAIPWFAQVSQQGCGLDHPIFCDLRKAHYTLRWVMRQLFRWLIRKNGEGKGGRRKDPA